MARPIAINRVIRFQKLRKQGMSYRAIQKTDSVLKGTDLKTMVRWSKYDVGKIVDKVLDV